MIHCKTRGLPLDLQSGKSRRLSLHENKQASREKYSNRMTRRILERISEGETDLVFEYVEAGHPARSEDNGSVSLIQWCAYYGDVSAIKFLLRHGETLKTLGENFDLNGAVFHGYPRLCQFLIEQGANVNKPLLDTGETPLHSSFAVLWRVSSLENKIGRASDPEKRGEGEQRLEPRNTRNTRNTQNVEQQKDRFGKNKKTPARKS